MPQDEPRAAAELDRLVADLREGDVYVELQDANLDEHRAVNPGLERLAADAGLPVVGTGDVHYLRAEDAGAARGAALHPDQRPAREPEPLQVLDARVLPQEPVRDVPADAPGAATRCQRRRSRSPSAATSSSSSASTACRCTTRRRATRFGPARTLCEQGLRRALRRPDQRRDQRPPRVRAADVIQKMGFPDYFLIVWDFVDFAREQRHHGRPGPRLGRRLAGGLRPADHRHRPAALRPAVRALPEPRAASRCPTSTSTSRCDGRERGHPLRHREVRPRPRRPDHHLRKMAAKAAVRDAGRVMGLPLRRSSTGSPR